jgi:hypothetical protein
MGQMVGRLSGAQLTYYVGKGNGDHAPVGCTAPGVALDPSATVTVDVHLVAGRHRVGSVQALSAGIGRAMGAAV